MSARTCRGRSADPLRPGPRTLAHKKRALSAKLLGFRPGKRTTTVTSCGAGLPEVPAVAFGPLLTLARPDGVGPLLWVATLDGVGPLLTVPALVAVALLLPEAAADARAELVQLLLPDAAGSLATADTEAAPVARLLPEAVAVGTADADAALVPLLVLDGTADADGVGLADGRGTNAAAT